MSRLSQLNYFVTVAEEGQMTRAAAKLHLAQPALSQAIAQLESQLGVQLLTRHARGVSLTPAGTTFFEKASAALAALADANSTADSLSRAARGVVQCGFIGAPPTIEAPSLFGEFARLHSDVEVFFHELPMPSDAAAAWLEQMDVAVCFAPTEHAELETVVLRNEPRVLVAASAHPLASKGVLTVAEVLDETFCGTDPMLEPVRLGFWRLDDLRGGPARITDDRARTPQEIAAVVASGRAVWTAAASSARLLGFVPGVVAVPLTDAGSAALALIWRKGDASEHVAALAEIARAGAGQAPAELGALGPVGL
jgi:DNA-binding transcriptional LysR family regulator